MNEKQERELSEKELEQAAGGGQPFGASEVELAAAAKKRELPDKRKRTAGGPDAPAFQATSFKSGRSNSDN